MSSVALAGASGSRGGGDPGLWTAGGEGAAGAGPGARLALALPGAGGREAPAPDYAPYLSGLRRRIQEALRYPLAARRRGLAGTVHLELLIEPDGAIRDVTVVSSSAHAVLDEAALAAVRSLAARPFPPGLAPRVLRVRLPVVFALE